MSQSKAVQRILNELGRTDLIEYMNNEISASDLNTLLLELFHRQTNGISYADLLRKYASNRFVQPAELDPIALKQMEIQLLTLAQSYAYQAIQLSPVTPLGSCSVVATSDQNKIISALRGTEVVADATNALALHICHSLKENKLTNDEDFIRFCTTHRHVRAQHFNKPGLLSHFHLYCMVTSGKDKGSYSFEKQALLEHLLLYQHIFESLFHANIKVKLNRVEGYTDSEGLIHRLAQHIREGAPTIPVIENTIQGTNQYYRGLQFTIIVTIDGQELNIGDGGFVDWSQKLLGNKRERILISAIGLERLVGLKP